MRFVLVFLLSILMSCGSDRIIELPEIQHSTITELTDISPAYLFYDEMQPGSTELNRKNLISTTNWVVNVDKRLTLGQAIPKIQFLQQKKNNSSHKNENAKNYYTCNNTSIKNLGFIEFTKVYYLLNKKIHDENNLSLKNWYAINISDLNAIQVKSESDSLMFDATINKLVNKLNSHPFKKPTELILNLSEDLTFQEYITLKDELTRLDSDDIIIHSNEFIY